MQKVNGCFDLLMHIHKQNFHRFLNGFFDTFCTMFTSYFWRVSFRSLWRIWNSKEKHFLSWNYFLLLTHQKAQDGQFEKLFSHYDFSGSRPMEAWELRGNPTCHSSFQWGLSSTFPKQKASTIFPSWSCWRPENLFDCQKKYSFGWSCLLDFAAGY